jgi:ribosomal 50S subunit-recycling heat shock protein
MRLDLFLKASRLVIRRTVAQAMCDAGAIWVNGAAAKSSRAVKTGDELKIARADRTLTVRILSVPATKQMSKQSAGELYEVISDVPNPLENLLFSE